MIENLIISFATGIAMSILYHKLCPKRRIHCCDEGWKPISTFPHGEDRKLLLTDGEEVKYGYSAEYDKDGDIVIGYPKQKATHWREVPKPPYTI